MIPSDFRLFLCICAMANRASATIVAVATVFPVFVFSVAQTGLLPAAGTEASLHVVAKIALLILLFLGAARIDQEALLMRLVWRSYADHRSAVGVPVWGCSPNQTGSSRQWLRWLRTLCQRKLLWIGRLSPNRRCSTSHGVPTRSRVGSLPASLSLWSN